MDRKIHVGYYTIIGIGFQGGLGNIGGGVSGRRSPSLRSGLTTAVSFSRAGHLMMMTFFVAALLPATTRMK